MEIIISYSAQATRFEHLYNCIKIGQLFVMTSFIKLEKPNIITIEATDIDYLSFFNTNYDVTKNSSIMSTTCTEINQITNEFSTSSTLTTLSEQFTFVNAEIATSRKGKK
ncbi:4765_t:CDS:2, partial [Cetraspora pellucida]